MHLNSAKLGSLEQRWAAYLASFQFEIKHRPRRINQSADALSRFPPAVPASDSEDARDGLEISSFAYIGAQAAKAMCISAGRTPRLGSQHVTPGTPLFPERTPGQWQRLQSIDPTLARVLMYLQRGRQPNKRERQLETQSVWQTLRHWHRLPLIDCCVLLGLRLCRTQQDPKEIDPIIQVLVPEGERHSVWQLYHEQAGHWGPEKTVLLIQKRFFWPHLAKDVTD